jgi:hypothetical protein
LGKSNWKRNLNFFFRRSRLAIFEKMQQREKLYVKMTSKNDIVLLLTKKLRAHKNQKSYVTFKLESTAAPHAH